ncbi:ATP-dependent nuclease [Engelhardtia mirabilis]|uniref:Recombination protein F n=1 Tax=Engelhardtia mirabilis TaxID=2528011 RepID=A0A518BRN4_9BACT|nr:hypothetical protein Pla133_47590 [Planctomycetes bacterium Pla133]QDV03964.1 hypothetical protein Pla86_47570 [Planctomycetes bacterium Pla86]
MPEHDAAPEIEELAATAVDTEPDRPGRLRSILVRNFRAIGATGVEIELDDIVVLVGPNNAGKSSILRAYELVMAEGTGDEALDLDDFPNRQVIENALPTIETTTALGGGRPPAAKYIYADTETGERLVKERWVWHIPGAKPVRQGFDVELGQFVDEKPWGFAGVAKPNRPRPHVVGPFMTPADISDRVSGILSSALKKRQKNLREDEGPNGQAYRELTAQLASLQSSLAEAERGAVAGIEARISEHLGSVFGGFNVRVDARAEDQLEKSLSLFKSAPILRMGRTAEQATDLSRQGSGTCRALFWATLMALAESSADGETNMPTDLLIVDEPELSLHPDRIRSAADALYTLAERDGWQVMIATHSPVFVDFRRDHTSIVRVEIDDDHTATGCTIFRPSKAHFDDDDRQNLKLLNICDPHVAEFFFGGRVVVVEGDTEYAALQLAANSIEDDTSDVHVVRARGKWTIASVAKILNQFNVGYSVLHDSDAISDAPQSPWAANQRILDATAPGRETERVRLVASVPNFEEAYLQSTATADKPYRAVKRLTESPEAMARVQQLLRSLLSPDQAIPEGAVEWSSMDDLRHAVAEAAAAVQPTVGARVE